MCYFWCIIGVTKSRWWATKSRISWWTKTRANPPLRGTTRAQHASRTRQKQPNNAPNHSTQIHTQHAHKQQNIHTSNTPHKTPKNTDYFTCFSCLTNQYSIQNITITHIVISHMYFHNNTHYLHIVLFVYAIIAHSNH